MVTIIDIKTAESEDELNKMLKQYGSEDRGGWMVVAGNTWILKFFEPYRTYSERFVNRMMKKIESYPQA